MLNTHRDTESASSSVMSVDSRSMRILVKNLGQRMNMVPNISLVKYIFLLFVYLIICTIACTEIINQMFINFLTDNNNNFKSYSNIARLDTSFKSGIEVFSENYNLLNVLLYPSLYDSSMNSTEKQRRIDEANFALDSLKLIIGSNDVVGFVKTKIKDTSAELSIAIQKILGSLEVKDLDKKLQGLILSTRIEFIQYIDWEKSTLIQTRVSMVQLANFLRAQLDRLSLRFEYWRSVISNGNLPYTISQTDLDYNFRFDQPQQLSAIRVCYENYDDMNKELLDDMEKILTDTRIKTFYTNSSIYIAVLLVFFLFFQIFAVWFGISANSYIFKVSSQYENLRPEELELSRRVCSSRTSFIAVYKLNELELIEKYKRTTQYGFVELKEGEILIQKTAENQSIKKLKRAKRFKGNFLFDSVKLVWLIAFICLVIVGILIIVLNLEINVISTVTELISFYSNSYQKFNRVRTQSESHFTYLIFGNSFKLSQTLLSESISVQKGESRIQELLGYLISKRSSLIDYFGATDGLKLDKFIFEDVCFAVQTDFSSSIRRDICNQMLAAKKGMVSFMNAESDLLREMRDLFSTKPSFEISSITKSDEYPFMMYFFSPEVLRLKFINRYIYQETGLKILMDSGDRRIYQEIDQVNRLVGYINRIGNYVVMSIFALISVYFVTKRYVYDMQIGSETIRIMLPEVIIYNKLIQQVFKDVFPAKI